MCVRKVYTPGRRTRPLSLWKGDDGHLENLSTSGRHMHASNIYYSTTDCDRPCNTLTNFSRWCLARTYCSFTVIHLLIVTMQEETRERWIPSTLVILVIGLMSPNAVSQSYMRGHGKCVANTLEGHGPIGRLGTS